MTEKNKVFTIIVAAGSGKRLNNQIPKQYLSLNEFTILENTIRQFLENNNISDILLVVSKDHEIYYRPIIDKYNLKYCFGGETRQESVCLGLEAIYKYNPKKVLIHDAARPFTNSFIINEIIRALDTEKAAIPAKKLKDTIKKISENFVSKTYNRDDFILAETPQGFKYDLIYYLHQKYKNQNFTDDASLCEEDGIKVKLVLHNFDNTKITTEDDYLKYKNLNNKMEIKIGNGFDVHSFEEGDFIMLCGIKIPFNKKFKAHSDGDVAWHALTDAILGAIAEGDIGEIFPDSNNDWKNANSIIFLQKANEMATAKNFKISNIDITIIAEKPKLSDFKIAMKNNTALALGISPEIVNIKATTTEKLGFTGRGEGIAAQASVCLISKIN